MPQSDSEAVELTYPLRAAARLTGLSPSVLRAWERRYGVVVPVRTPGGTRRYSAADLERLRLVKEAVDAGNRIGRVARLDLGELRSLIEGVVSAPTDRFDEVVRALEQLDGMEAQRLLAIQLSTLGPIRFAREFALPLVYEIGERWANGRLGIAPEHLATGVLRAMLGSALVPSAKSSRGPRIVFATPTGEHHELGLQMAALTALGAGANPIYLGAELPAEELLDAVDRSRAAVAALSIVSLAAPQAERAVRAIRGGLPREVHLWLGGAGASEVPPIESVEVIDDLESIEQRVVLLEFESRNEE